MPSTEGIINRDLFKEASNLSLLNFARHEVVNTDDVLDYLNNGCLRNFITDFPSPELIKRANEDYHTHDSPKISDAEFDELKELYSDYKIPFWMNTRAETITE